MTEKKGTESEKREKVRVIELEERDRERHTERDRERETKRDRETERDRYSEKWTLSV